MDSTVELHISGLEALLAAVHADDPKRELLVRVGDAIREARSAATLIAELQADRDSFRFMADKNYANWSAATDERDVALERALAAESSLHRVRGETVEECAKVAENFGACIFYSLPAKAGQDARSDLGKRIRSLNKTGLDSEKTGAVG